MVSPTTDCESSSPFVCVRNVEDCEGWKLRINRDGDILAQIARLAGQRQTLARTEYVRHALAAARAQGKVAPGSNAIHRLRRGKRSQKFWVWPQQCNDTTAEKVV